MKYLVKKFVKTLKASSIKSAWGKCVFYLKHDFPGELIEDEAGVLLKTINLYIKRNSFQFILEQYSIIKVLDEYLKANFYFKDDVFFISFDDLVLMPTTAEEIFIIQEIFVHGSYNFEAQGPFVVVDVGMNVGMASLFFASKKEVQKVYGFEPFELTYKQALKNISNNDKLKAKLSVQSFGLSNKNETLKVAYNYENKGQVGIYGTSLIRSKIDHEDYVSIELKRASEQIGKIVGENVGQRMVLKLDCEGAEYSILNDLVSNNLLATFKIVFIEWHEQGPDELLKLLFENGFTSFYQQASRKKVGMIYASK